MAEFLTGEQIMARLKKPACEECGALRNKLGITFLRDGDRFIWSVECWQCGATESFEEVASGN